MICFSSLKILVNKKKQKNFSNLIHEKLQIYKT